ncbi:hypothetical protein BY458DRAFT_532779 [Sporodiniella umbellata]|nr:hypothetical protein BY458DRAFT_532779 [Sporodiniella umbellata]
MYNTTRTSLEAKIVILGSQGNAYTIDHNRVSLQIWDTAGQELRRNMTEELVIVVVANKKDLPLAQHEVQKKEAQEFVERYLGPEANLYQVSAREDDGQIEEIFVEIARKLVERLQNYPPRRQLTHTHLEEEPTTTQSSCCGF